MHEVFLLIRCIHLLLIPFDTDQSREIVRSGCSIAYMRRLHEKSCGVSTRRLHGDDGMRLVMGDEDDMRATTVVR